MYVCLIDLRKDKGWDYHPKVGLVIAGGKEGSYLDKVERSSDNGVTFQELPKLPNIIIALCLVIVDNERIFTAGGHTVHPSGKVLSNAYMLNLTESDEGWIELQSMSFPRFLHTCGKVGPELVAKRIAVVGGCNDGNCQMILKSVEIYTVASGSWDTGKQGLLRK